jgi:hypothetical protein
MSKPLTVIEGMSYAPKKEFDAEETKKNLESLAIQFETSINNGGFHAHAMAKSNLKVLFHFHADKEDMLTNFFEYIEKEVDNGVAVYTFDLDNHLYMKFSTDREYTYFCEVEKGVNAWNCLKSMGFEVEEITDD